MSRKPNSLTLCPSQARQLHAGATKLAWPVKPAPVPWYWQATKVTGPNAGKSAVAPEPSGFAWDEGNGCTIEWPPKEPGKYCPHGKPGEVRWCKEIWQPFYKGGAIYLADAGTHRLNATSEEQARKFWPKWRSARTMPQWAARYRVKIASVAVKRLSQFTAKEILAMGLVERSHNDQYLGKCPIGSFDGKIHVDLLSLLLAWYEDTNGKGSHASNPWCWLLTIEKLTQGAGA